MRILALVLVLAAVGSFVVSFASHEQDVTPWTMYTPLSNDQARDGITPIDEIDAPFPDDGSRRVYEYPDVTYDEYDHMPWDDARLWLGLAIGFAVSAVGVGVVALRRQS